MASILLCLGTIVAQPISAGYFVPESPDEASIPEVSLAQLFAAPQLYEGKRVRIVGYLHLEFEGNAIYPRREDFVDQRTPWGRGFWMEIPRNLTRAQKDAVNNSYVICTGVFTAKFRGHMGLFGGAMSDINRLEPTHELAPKPLNND